jgi:hypothetical protein
MSYFPLPRGGEISRSKWFFFNLEDAATQAYALQQIETVAGNAFGGTAPRLVG